MLCDGFLVLGDIFIGGNGFMIYFCIVYCCFWIVRILDGCYLICDLILWFLMWVGEIMYCNVEIIVFFDLVV